jgi:hypothetical protein
MWMDYCTTEISNIRRHIRKQIGQKIENWVPGPRFPFAIWKTFRLKSVRWNQINVHLLWPGMTTTLRTRDSKNVTGPLGEVMKILSLQGIKQRFISCPASRIATVLTELSYTHTHTHTHTHTDTHTGYTGGHRTCIFWLKISTAIYFLFIYVVTKVL